jgi:hypothetical protein
MNFERGAFMRRLLLTLVCFAALSIPAFAQDDHCDSCPLQVGYAVVTITKGFYGSFSGAPGGLTAFETLGLRSEVPALQAGVLPATLTTRLTLFANADIRISANVGVGIMNPAAGPAVVTMTLRDVNGNLTASDIITIGPLQQASKFISEFFANVPNTPPNFAGTLTVTSDTPVGIVALAFNGTIFTTIPITSLSPAALIPQLTAVVGGPSGVIFPQFAANAGWASEIVLVNNSSAPLTARIDVFQPNGASMMATLNHLSANSFQNLVIAPGGVVVVAPLNLNGDSDF